MKKKITAILAVLFTAADVLVLLLYWKNYMYYWSSLDKAAIGAFAAVCIVVAAIVAILCTVKAQEGAVVKTVISVSALFLVFTAGYWYYNRSVHKKINADDVLFIESTEGEYSKEEQEELIKKFNGAGYVKRNPSEEAEGTPDEQTVIRLSDGTHITLTPFGRQTAVQVTGKKSGSCYWIDVTYPIR